MAHFAEVASDGIVNRVVVVSDEDAGEDCSQAGVDWCDKNIPKTDPDCKWIQTSYNLNFRGRYAGTGYSWDEDDEIFVAPQPFPSWLRTSDGDWEPPDGKSYPDNASDNDIWEWDEENQEWAKVWTSPE